MSRRIISFILSFGLLFQQVSFAQVAAELNIASYLSRLGSNMVLDKFRPLHLRYFSYDALSDNFKVLLDKGDVKLLEEKKAQGVTKTLLSYFLIGVTLPDDMFWVNLRPDSEDQIIDPYLEKTDVGKVMLEADLQLKKDTALFTSPQTPEGNEYRDKLYKKAAELYGYDNVSIPTLTRPWIVPGEIIVRESKDSAYVYKATLKVMLEQDYLKDSATYNFKDERSKALNEYSSQLIRELIIPKLTREVNSSKRYAPLRQVYYSLILSRWFKLRFTGKTGTYASLINTKNLTNLMSQETWSKTDYFKQYQKSFADGEYNIKEPVYTPMGQVIRSYFSGGINVANSAINTQNGIILSNDNVNKLGDVIGGKAVANPQNISLKPVVSSPIDASERGQDRAPLVYPYSAFSIPLISDASTLKAIEDHMLLVQAGKTYKNGKALVDRYAALTNWIWTDLLRDKDVVGVKLHQEKLSLTAEYNAALKRKDFKTAREKLQRYVEIRDLLCQRWLSLAIDAGQEKSGLPKYAYEYARKAFSVKDYELVAKLYRQYGDNLRNMSLYTWDPIAELVQKANAVEIALFPLGAGGPGTNIIAASEHGVGYIKNFLEENGINQINEDEARAIIRGDKKYSDQEAELKGYLPFKIGMDPMKINGFAELKQLRINLPEGPKEGVFDQKAGQARELMPGETIDGISLVKGLLFMTSVDQRTGKRVNFDQGKPLDTSWIKNRIRLNAAQAREILRFAKDNGIELEVIAHLRGVDGCGSGLDLPEFQLDLTKENARMIIDFPSTPTIASEFTVKIRFELGSDTDTITYVAPDYGITADRPYSVRDVLFEIHPDSKKAALGMKKLKNGQKDAPAYIFKDIFGINGIKITCESISPMALAGGMESSNAFNVALIAAASMLSGADLNYADIFNLAVKLENDEFNGLTGGQGHLSSMLGGAYHNIWLSGVRAKHPFASSPLVNSKLIEATEALSIIMDYLKSGEIVIFGDMHRGERKPQDDEVWDHELFLDYVEQLGELSMNFSVALEFPHQLEAQLNNPSISVEDFLDEYYKLLAAKNSVELAKVDSEIRGPYLSRLLSTLKRFNIPVILIDDINIQRNGGLFTDIDVIKQSNKDMAQKLLEGRKKYSNDSILLMVGRNHMVPKISSIWLGGREINSIPGVLRDSGASVKLARPDDFQYDEEDLAKIDLIIKVDGKRQKEYLVRQGGVSPKGSSALGGIDFRILPMTIQPMGSFSGLSFKLPQLSQAELEQINIGLEMQQIKNMVQAGIVPSGSRIKELVAACVQKGEMSSHIDNLLLCLVDILKLEEDNASESSPELREALVIVDSQS